MDLTPATLREVEFREKLRGYHPDDVDDFLEEVAVALEGLLTRLSSAESGMPAPAPSPPPARQPERAVEPLFEPPPPPPVERHEPPPSAAVERSQPPTPVIGDTVTDDTLRRTLVLAQRTAELAMAEAEEAARELLESAHAEANRVRDEAHERASRVVADAEGRKAALEREIAALTGWAVQHRDRIREALNEQVRSLDVWLAASTPPAAVRASRRLGMTTPRALGAHRETTSLEGMRADQPGADQPRADQLRADQPGADDSDASAGPDARTRAGGTRHDLPTADDGPTADDAPTPSDMGDEADATALTPALGTTLPDPPESRNQDNSDEPRPLAPRVFRRR